MAKRETKTITMNAKLVLTGGVISGIKLVPVNDDDRKIVNEIRIPEIIGFELGADMELRLTPYMCNTRDSYAGFFRTPKK